MNLPSQSCHLFVKSAIWTFSTSYSSLMRSLCSLSANSCFKVPFCGGILKPNYHTELSNITPNQTHIYPQSVIDISQYQDKTVINHHHDSDLSFRSDSSGAVPSPGWVRHHMSAVIDSSQFCQLAAGELQGKIRTSICVVPNGRLGSREGPLQPWWYL